jgi:hypothetical protein
MGEEKKRSFWQRLFPGSLGANQGANANVQSPSTANYEDFVADAIVSGSPLGDASGEDEYQLTELPNNRLIKYKFFRVMADDPTIDSALKMHISHALSAKSDTGEIISIESTSDKDDPITIDLRNTFKETVNRNVQFWAYNAALNGIGFARIYGQPRKGVELVRSDYYCHPQFIRAYEQAGQIAGYTAAHQNPSQNAGYIALMEPWKFIAFRVPIWKSESDIEPPRLDGSVFDISNDDFRSESIIESQNYGTSLIETAYGPWMDLQEAILSMNMSRKNAARLERLIGVNTGKLSPQRASQYLNTVSSQLLKVNQANAKQSLRRGYVQTVINHLIPIFGDGKGRLDIASIEGNANIDGLEDINFHVKRLGSALGIDPSLLGFGEMLSGGLGDGGFFRISVLAAIKANMLRRAVSSGLENLFDIHVAYKYGKVFLPGEKPWRIVFNSVSSALEREERENLEGRVTFATMIGQLVGLIDAEFSSVDRNALANYMFTDIMKIDEEKFRKMFPGKITGPVGGQELGPDGQPIATGEEEVLTESASVKQMKSIVNRYIEGLYAAGK